MSDGEGNKNQGLTSKIQIPYFDPASNKISAEASSSWRFLTVFGFKNV